jgi:hypothetical protein
LPSIPSENNQNLNALLAQLQNNNERNNANQLKLPGGAQQVQTSRNIHTRLAPSPTENLETNAEPRNLNFALKRLQKIAASSKVENVAEVIKHKKQQERINPKIKVPTGSRRIVQLQNRQQPSRKVNNVQKSSSEKKERGSLRNFFDTRKRISLFNRGKSVENVREKSIIKEETGSKRKEDKPGFPNFDIDPSVNEDKDGNVVISGGRKVFHLPPGIAPPPGAFSQPSLPSSGRSDDRSQVNFERQKDPVFFDVSDAPQVAEVLSKSKSSVIQVRIYISKEMRF